MALLTSHLSKHKFNHYFQFWWTPRYGVICKGDKVICGLCSEKVVLPCRTTPIRQHYETIHKSLWHQPIPVQRKTIATFLKERKKGLTKPVTVNEYVSISSESDTNIASVLPANDIAKHDEEQRQSIAWTLKEQKKGLTKHVTVNKDVSISRESDANAAIFLPDNVIAKHDAQRKSMASTLKEQKKGLTDTVNKDISISQESDTNAASFLPDKVIVKHDQEQRKSIATTLIERKNGLTEPVTVNKCVSISQESDTNAASFLAAYVIAKHGKPFADGEFLKEAWLASAPLLFDDFENKDRIIQRIKDMSLSGDTIKYRILKLAEYVSGQQKIKIKSSPFVSLCLNVITDVTKSSRLAIFARYFVANDLKEELIALTKLTTNTGGTDVYTAVKKTLAEKEIDLSKVVSITSDADSRIVQKKVSSFETLIGHSIFEFHCIVSPQVLFDKGETSLEDITAVISKLVNTIASQALNIQKFDELLNEVNTVFKGLPMTNNVRWLNHGRVLQKFVDNLEEIRQFLQYDGLKRYPQLMDIMWLASLMFYTDLCQHFNEFNNKLQAPHKTIISMIDVIRDFEVKLQLYITDITTKTYKYFPNMKNVEIHEKRKENIVSEELVSVIRSLIEDFSVRFGQFREIYETLELVICPDNILVEELDLHKFGWLNINEIERQLAELQSSSTWSQRFVDLREELETVETEMLNGHMGNIADTKIIETWNSIPDSFSYLKKLAFAILTLFPSTCTCESLISELNNINRFSDEDDYISDYLLLKLTKYDPDIKQFTSEYNDQDQEAH